MIDDIWQTKTLVHMIRLANLGEDQEAISDKVGITSRYWNKLKYQSDSSFSDRLFEKVSVMAVIHRPSPSKVGKEKTKRLSIWAKAMEAYFKKASNIADLKEAVGHLGKILLYKDMSSDWGLLDLYAAGLFGVWRLEVGLINPNPTMNSRQLLKKAAYYWEMAANNCPEDFPQFKLIVKINILTVATWEEAFFLNNGVQYGNIERYYKYHQFATEFPDLIPNWRDSLEQAALLKDENLITENLGSLFEAVERRSISVTDQYEVLLKEIEQIDNHEEVENIEIFKNWKANLKKAYRDLKLRRAS
jgi:hypothetical protein